MVEGVRFATIAAGVKYTGRADVMLAELAPGTTIAGTFTRSKTRAAPVLDCQAKLGGPSDAPGAILVNSGNANAFTGIKGVEAVEAVTAAVASAINVPQARIFTASTGVIGEPLPHERITSVVSELGKSLSPDKIEDAAKAIMTTDTFPKGASRQIEIDGKPVTISGFAKGSGMIAPDMATMLVYIFTDAKLPFDELQPMVSGLCEGTFNSITVDSDTSTSDTLLVAATGTSGVDVVGNGRFAAALFDVMDDLAKQVVRDGEGATKFVTVSVKGAASDADAKQVAMSIANSPLVKTAIAGEDANWGRVVMAVGKSGAEADRDRLSISFGKVAVARNGQVADGYDEAAATEHMKGQDVNIGVDLGIGDGSSTVYTCDLTAGYIAINADYRS
ncbi:MAG: bifunctional glutamate N-acetyltransferase/amino-acid acetyltransferase ArgJ [Boseongicola sp.]|nr:bifunctional glutamate N-acetyltransferase/amino-acid acetyltransferase ArgJ [Boseongicola sp.]NNL18492.1 bifunctional glutamate N-acetyltransferase/amino-acid acetyltransferase ArgJ [Boseongicola sp.]